jgi:hypothetical protein
MTHVTLISSGNHNGKLYPMIINTVPRFPACGKLKMNSKGIKNHRKEVKRNGNEGNLSVLGMWL